MRRIISFISYSLAILATPVILATFIGMPQWQQVLMQQPFMKLDPIYTGGDVIETISDSTYTIDVHERIHPGWHLKRGKGFVQVEITPKDTLTNALDIEDIIIDGKHTSMNLSMTSTNATNMTIVAWCKTEKGWILRVE